MNQNANECKRTDVLNAKKFLQSRKKVRLTGQKRPECATMRGQKEENQRMNEENERISALLLAWYDENARTLPWRGIHDPYRTWVSETMLQQTRVETVRGYYDRFLARFPDVQTLAAADEADVLKRWEGLGYYSRARNLHQAAQQIVRDFGGEMPADVAQLRQLKGVGAYTAGAIASIAFDQRVPAVDGNVIRVVSRVKGIRENVGIPSVRRALEEAAGALVPAVRPGDFNQALMDLGSAVCVPGTPNCDDCPLQAHCDAFDAGDAEELPVLPQKNPPKQLDWDVLLIRSGDRVLMRQRTEALLHGLWVFPMLAGHEVDARTLEKRMRTHDAVLLGEAKHVFTHQVWQMRVWRMEADAEEAAKSGEKYVTAEEMEALTIPTAMKKAKEWALAWVGEQAEKARRSQ